MLHRHFYTAALAAICIISVISGAVAQCQVRPRREIRRLSPQERESYFNAIRQLQSTGRPSAYDEFAKRHLDAHQAAHGTAQFLPWHRWFIRDFEQALQSINPDIMLPYWDWSVDSQQPAASPIFRPDWYGGNGNPQADYCLQDGKFANFRPFYPQPHCLRRRFNNGSRLTAFHSPAEINNILQFSNYLQFKEALEGTPHATVHINIGSNIADISTMYSPNDPIFWLHHAFIDKIWADWQAQSVQNAQAYQGGSRGDSGPINLSNRLFQSPLTVGDVMDTRLLCYYYEPYGTVGQTGTRTSRLRRDLSTVSTSNNETTTANTTTPAQDNKNKTATTTTTCATTVPVQPNTNSSYASTQNNSTTLLNAPYVGDKIEVLALQQKLPIPKSWIEMNFLNETSVRIYEKKNYEFVEALNADFSHISLAAPFLNHDMFKYIVESASTITCTLGGRTLTINLNKRISDMVMYIRSLLEQIFKFIADINKTSFNEIKDKAVKTLENLVFNN